MSQHKCALDSSFDTFYQIHRIHRKQKRYIDKNTESTHLGRRHLRRTPCTPSRTTCGVPLILTQQSLQSGDNLLGLESLGRIGTTSVSGVSSASARSVETTL